MILSQNDGVRAQYGEAEAKISSIVDGITTIIHNVVADKLEELKGSMHLGEETSKLLEKMVQVSCANTAASIKISLDAELLRSAEEMQHKIARCVEESTRETSSTSPASSGCHFNFAGATAETYKLSNTRERLVDEAAIKTLVNEALHREMELASECKREPQQMQSTEEDRASFEAQIITTIERTVQAAATTIGDAIQTGFCSLERRARQYAEENESENYSDDEMSPEDIELDQNICDAWRKTYLHTHSSQDSSNEQISGRNQDQESQYLATTPSTHLQAPLQQAVAQRCNQTSDLYSNPANLVVVIQPLLIQSRDHTQRLSSARHALNSSPPPSPQ
ncbi:unnamed protein product [Phytophthora fragariaefolia]|uniref:Unnamed protein product n=1 Tax=Phytophthora fragariaefolia TaxID=1490495 RepID=A0A9W6TY83_9STRA|nr:unnamed protein product [Phytophthora fragariaefolia]